jgi:hypothetical protein
VTRLESLVHQQPKSRITRRPRSDSKLPGSVLLDFQAARAFATTAYPRGADPRGSSFRTNRVDSYPELGELQSRGFSQPDDTEFRCGISVRGQERLIENKRLSARRTKMPTLLQGLLVCGQCGYGLYWTSTKTTKQQVQYYRCLVSDRYRHLRGPTCQCRPIRQDYLDELVWEEVVQLLNEPQHVRAEIERRN